MSETSDPYGPIHGRPSFREHIDRGTFPAHGLEPDEAYELLHTGLMLDGRETLNLASFVTTWMEPQAEKLIHDTLRKNHIDHEEYPAASLIEEACVHMLGDLFNAPDPTAVVGVATIGSSEAIMLGLLAHKRAWRDRRQAAGLPTDRPNVVFGAETHVVWDKFANYFDVEMRKIPMKPDRFVLSADDVEAHVDENTIAVGAVLGTTHIGEADPIEEINDLLVRIKAEKGWDIPLHVDGASGAFIAPFAEPDLRWDFRLEQVASINASGHKYGLVYPGVGWLIFRDASKLPEDLVFSVNYLGGAQPTYTFNFSRGSAMIQAQMYNFLRLGRSGYTSIVETMLANARFLNESLEASGRFEILNPGLAEPVVTFTLKGDPGSTSTTCRRGCARTAGSCPRTACRPTPRTVHLMRVVVRLDLSRMMIEQLLRDLFARLRRARGRAADAASRRRSPTCGRRPRTPRPTEQGAHRPGTSDVTPTRPEDAGPRTCPRDGACVSTPGPGPFVTHARARAPRRERGRVELAAAPQGTRPASGAAATVPARGGRAERVELVDRRLFAIGSICFALGSLPAVLRRTSPARWSPATFFVGSIFFTSPPTCSTTSAPRARAGSLAGRRGRARLASLVGWKPRRIDFVGGDRQLVGTVFFNITTFAATQADLPSPRSGT